MIKIIKFIYILCFPVIAQSSNYKTTCEKFNTIKEEIFYLKESIKNKPYEIKNHISLSALDKEYNKKNIDLYIQNKSSISELPEYLRVSIASSLDMEKYPIKDIKELLNFHSKDKIIEWYKEDIMRNIYFLNKEFKKSAILAQKLFNDLENIKEEISVYRSGALMILMNSSLNAGVF